MKMTKLMLTLLAASMMNFGCSESAKSPEQVLRDASALEAQGKYEGAFNAYESLIGGEKQGEAFKGLGDIALLGYWERTWHIFNISSETDYKAISKAISKAEHAYDRAKASGYEVSRLEAGYARIKGLRKRISELKAQEEKRRKAEEEEIARKEQARNEELAKMEQAREASYEAITAVKVSQIKNEYHENEISADQKYKGKKVKVTGNISEVGKTTLEWASYRDGVFVRIDMGDTTVHCEFVKENNSIDFATLKRGQSVTIEGEIIKVVGYLHLCNCSIVNR